MISRQVRELIRRQNERLEERHRGVGSAQMRMASQRALETLVINVAHLPCSVNTGQRQDADGNFLYLEGYSDPTGPDVGAPGGG